MGWEARAEAAAGGGGVWGGKGAGPAPGPAAPAPHVGRGRGGAGGGEGRGHGRGGKGRGHEGEACSRQQRRREDGILCDARPSSFFVCVFSLFLQSSNGYTGSAEFTDVIRLFSLGSAVCVLGNISGREKGWLQWK